MVSVIPPIGLSSKPGIKDIKKNAIPVILLSILTIFSAYVSPIGGKFIAKIMSKALLLILNFFDT